VIYVKTSEVIALTILALLLVGAISIRVLAILDLLVAMFN